MSIFSVFNKEKKIDKVLEKKIYHLISIEIQEGRVEKGLWTKAIADAAGENDKVESIYINLRYEDLKQYVGQFDQSTNTTFHPLDLFVRTQKEYHHNTAKKTKKRTTWIGQGKLFAEIIEPSSPYCESYTDGPGKLLQYDLEKGMVEKK